LLKALRGLLIGFVMGVFLVSSVASVAGPRQRLRDTRNELTYLRRRIESQQGKASSIKQRVNALNRDINRLQIGMNKLEAAIEDIQADVRLARERVKETRSEISAIRDIAIDQAVDLYTSGGSAEALDALLNARSLTELNDRIEMLGVAAQKNTGALIRYGRLRARLEDQARDLFDKKSELDRQLEDKSDLNDRLSDKRTELSEDLRSLHAKLGHEKNREGHLEKAKHKIKQRILSAQVGAELAALGVSSEGFIWPLNGPITSPFGYRWGRMHTGWDIDGYTGQPIAAAKSGVVIYLGSGMSGYGNVVMIDHGGGISTLYAHMSGYATSSGASVRQGEIIGYVGCTGNCYGDHLHFEVRVNGNPVDPGGYLP
jgi:murein DD-endopeptidase MepM/ murein hydrolase activator NlpD